MANYDLVIIGGGAAAFAAANTANKLKKKTLLINDKKILPIGGTCVNVGCVPSKIMLYQGAQYYYPSHSKFRAIKLKGTANFGDALKETREMVKGFQSQNYGKVIKKQHFVDFKEGHAEFVNNQTVKVGKEQFKAKYILIATGASTYVPDIKGIHDIDYLTNVSAFDLKKAPKSVIIVGGGPLGIEFSQIFSNFGVKVTVLQRSSRILAKHDILISNALRTSLEKEGITIHTTADTTKVRKTKNKVKVSVNIDGKSKTLTADKLMLAAGLSPHTKRLGIEKTGIKLSERGFIKVDKHLKTSKKSIYAAGDVTGLMALETVAAKQGNVAVLNMFKNTKKTINYNEIPNAVFTTPEVASVGITEEAYKKKYGTCLCTATGFNHVEKAGAIKETNGVIRMVLDHRTKRVIGVHIVGPLAADIITTATYAIKNKMTIYDIRDTVHVFPTLSEVIKKAAQSFDQNLDEMACCVE